LVIAKSIDQYGKVSISHKNRDIESCQFCLIDIDANEWVKQILED